MSRIGAASAQVSQESTQPPGVAHRHPTTIGEPDGEPVVARSGGKMVLRVEARTPAERIDQVSPPPARTPHSTASHGLNLRPDQKEVWIVDGVYGYVYAFDVTSLPPKQTASIPLFETPAQRPHPGWITFGIDGHYAYPDGGAVIDAQSKQVVARIPTSEKLIEVDFDNGKPVRAGHR